MSPLSRQTDALRQRLHSLGTCGKCIHWLQRRRCTARSKQPALACTALTEFLTSRTKVYRNFPNNLISMFTKRNWLGESFFISLSVHVQMLLTDSCAPFFSFLLFFSRVCWIIIRAIWYFCRWTRIRSEGRKTKEININNNTQEQNHSSADIKEARGKNRAPR